MVLSQSGRTGEGERFYRRYYATERAPRTSGYTTKGECRADIRARRVYARLRTIYRRERSPFMREGSAKRGRYPEVLGEGNEERSGPLHRARNIFHRDEARGTA